MSKQPTQQKLWAALERQVKAGDFEPEDIDDRASLSADPEFVFESLRTDLAEQLYRAMEDAGLNENQLAKKLGVSRQAVNEVLTMSTNMTLKSLAKFCVALNRRPVVNLLAPQESVAIKRTKLTRHSRSDWETNPASRAAKRTKVPTGQTGRRPASRRLARRRAG